MAPWHDIRHWLIWTTHTITQQNSMYLLWQSAFLSCLIYLYLCALCRLFFFHFLSLGTYLNGFVHFDAIVVRCCHCCTRFGFPFQRFFFLFVGAAFQFSIFASISILFHFTASICCHCRRLRIPLLFETIKMFSMQMEYGSIVYVHRLTSTTSEVSDRTTHECARHKCYDLRWQCI